MPVSVRDENGRVIGEARLRDVSDLGASLHVGNTLKLPQRFRLTMTKSGHVYRMCELVRRSLDTADVRFIDCQEDDAQRHFAMIAV